LKQFTAVTQANQKPAFVNVLIIQIMHNGSQKVQSLSIWVILEDVSNSFFTFGRLFETDEILAAEDILCGNIFYVDLFVRGHFVRRHYEPDSFKQLYSFLCLFYSFIIF